MSFLNKNDRQICWNHRDAYWSCLDKGKSESECEKLRKEYEAYCPSQWVKHFDRKREYLKFKEQIEKNGNCSSEGNNIYPNNSDVPIKLPTQKRPVLAFRMTRRDSSN